MNVAILKYNAGNVFSVVNALRRLAVEPVLTDDREALMSADKVIIPGQGEAGKTMKYLYEHHLNGVIKELKQPVLGICIGQQLMCKHSEEGDTECLGIFDVDVKRFVPNKKEQKVPCMGWNNLCQLKSPLFNGLTMQQLYVYFVHSYYVPLCANTIAVADYIQPYSAALNKDNFYATQFHPEKSGRVGSLIIENFLKINS